MNRRHSRWLVPLAVLVLAACAPGGELVRQGQRLIDQGRLEEGLAQIEKGLQLEPGNREYRMLAIRHRDEMVARLLAQAEAHRRSEALDEAAAQYRRVLELDANQPRARSGLEAIESLRLQRQRIDEAEALLARGRIDEADRRARQVLSDNPLHGRALALKRRLDDAAGRSAEVETPRLRPALRKPVTLDFRDASLKTVFEALARGTGVNFVFDREVRPDIKVTLSIADTGVEDVIAVIALTNQLEHKVLNDNTVVLYPATPVKQRDYLDLAVKTFYLANADAKSVFAMLKTVLKTRDLHADDRSNTLTMRDTPQAIRLAAKLIAAQDLAEPEVMLDVEVLEVKRSRMNELGIEPPGKFTALNIVPSPSTVVSTATGSTTVVDNTLTATQLTLDRLRDLNTRSIGIDNPVLNLRSEVGRTNILANPRIRVKNRDKARVLIGDRVPVITTTSTANVGVSESVTYLDVGLKLEVEPTIYLDQEVGVKVSLEVSNVVREVRGRSGSLTYQIGTRVASTQLRLRDGETQALAGLISDEDRNSVVGAPGATDLPILGRLFSSERSDATKTEIVLLITPRIVRTLAAVDRERNEHAGGTEAAVGSPALRLQGSKGLSMPPSAGPAAGAVQPQAQPLRNEPAPAADAERPPEGEQPAPEPSRQQTRPSDVAGRHD